MRNLVFIFILVLLITTPVMAAEWTLMVYLDGDNNLYNYAIDDLNEMKLVGSTDKINIIVLMDGKSTGDSKIYYVEHENTTVLLNLGEVNMGDPQTLIDFVTWCVNNYSADHYALIIWDHGLGWKRKFTSVKGVCWDDTNNSDYLTSSELQYALFKIKSTIGRDLDIIGFDACLMGMEEIDYLINESMPSAIRIGSEEIEFAPGWPYDMILKNLTANPSMTPKELAIEIVNDFYNYYDSQSSNNPLYQIATLSAVYVNNTIDEAVDNFVQAIMNSKDYQAVANARYRVEEFSLPSSDYIDLYNFTQLVGYYSNNETVKIAAKRLMDAINASVIVEKHGSLHPNVRGISIYFPATQIEYDYWNIVLPEPYESLKFAVDTKWDEFLKWFYSMPEPVIILESVPYVAQGDVAVFKGSVYGANSANWSLVGPYNGIYTNIPLVPLHHFVVLINTTDLFLNCDASTGNYEFKVNAGNVEKTYDFSIEQPRVSIDINDTTPKFGQVIEISGSTNAAPTGSIYDDETPNNISIFIDQNSHPNYILNVPANKTFHIFFRIPWNWSYGFHTFRVVVHTNEHFYGESYGVVEIMNPMWQNVDVLNTTKINVVRNETVRFHGKTTKRFVYIYADDANVFDYVSQLPFSGSFDVDDYPSLTVSCSNNSFVVYIHVSPTAPLGNHTLFFLATNSTTINQQTDLLAKIYVNVRATKLPPLPGHTKPPKDLDGDGVLDDFNGNGILDFDDVVELYKNMDWIKQNYPLSKVDQNKDGKLDFDDVIIIFRRI